MSRRATAGRAARIVDVDVTPVAPPGTLTFTDRISILQAQGVTVYRWGRSEDTSGTVYTMAVGANGTIVNPVTGDYDQGELLENSNGGSSIGMSGAFPDPTYIQVATVEQATWELTAFLQLDQAQTAGRMVMQVNSGADVAGGSECKFLADGASGMKFRFESADDTPTRVIKEGTTTAQIPIGETVMASFVRTAADMECYLNAEARTLTLLSGTLSTWSAPAAGSTRLGAFVGASASNGIDGLLGEWLITSPLTADQRAFLAAHARQNQVIALDLDAGEINEGAAAENYTLINRIHPAAGNTTAITTPASVGTAEDDTNGIVYTPPASVGSDTPDTVGYTNTVGAVTSAEATVSITILDSAAPEPPSTLAEDVRLPTPLVTKNATTTNISTVLSGAQPGDRINLNNGSYGALTISASGTQANPIVIRAANLHQATSETISVTGSWVIVSGLDITGSFRGNGSNIRCTRCLIHGSSLGFQAGPGAHDILVDHCEVYGTVDRMFYLADPKDQLRITVARCWCHSLSSGGSTPGSHGFLWADENVFREKPHDYIIVRLNYIGPGLSGDPSSDWVHDKQSDSIYAFNRFDQSGKLISMRFGLRKRFVGNYAPGMSVNMFDDLGWYYGNICGELRAMAGRSAYYDDTKNLATAENNSVGGFHMTKRTRIAGNTSSILLPWPENGPNNNWCTRTDPDPATLPDPQPCGVSKPARSFNGVTYAADNPSDPDKGIKIRNHSGTITQSTVTCANIPGDGRWQTNIDSQTGVAAPAHWKTELFTQHPWIEALCPNPTSSTGAPAGAHPSSVAQALTRGDAATPHTGPFRDSPGGLP